jgi:hypothetical protein
MTQDEIMTMARQAGFEGCAELTWEDVICTEELVAFAKLVAEHEREIWERRCERLQSLMDIRETQPNKPCCLAEREACAKVCEDSVEYAGDTLADAIRARGQE